MTCSELCMWLAECGLPENVISSIRGKCRTRILNVYHLLNIFSLTLEQDIDGDSFLQLSSLSREDLSKELDCKLTFGAFSKLRNVLNQTEGISVLLLYNINFHELRYTI